MSLTVTHHRSQQIDAPPLVIPDNQIYHLLFGVTHHLLARQIGISLSGTGIQQTQEIIDFGSGPYCRTGIFIGRLLFDGNHRT